MPTRILYLYTTPYRPDSGHARRSEQIIGALATLGYEIHILTPPPTAPWQLPTPHIHTTLPLPRLATMPLYRPSLRRLLCHLLTLIKAIHLNIRTPYTAIHCCDHSITIGRWISWFIRARLIIEWRNRPNRTLTTWSHSRFRQRILRSASLIISDEKCALTQAKACDCSHRLAYIPPIPSPPIQATPQPTPLFHLDPPRQTPLHITTLASHTGFQGLDTFFNAAPHILAAFPNTVFHIAGGDQTAIDKTLQTIALRLPQIQPRLDFTGPLPLPQLSQLLQASHILYARHLPGSHPPISLLDQMASHRPIVAADCPANTAILHPAIADLTPPDPEKTADAIIHLLNDPQRRLDLAAAAHHTLQTDHNPHTFLETIRTCYAYALER